MRYSHSALLLFVFALLGGCSKAGKSGDAAGEEASPAVPVQVAAAEQTTMHSFVNVEAVLFPLKQATITPKISAPVARFYVQRGDHVRQGQLLATLESRDLNAAAQEGKQLFEQSEASYEATSAATMPDDLVKAKTDVQSAQEALDAAQKVYDNRQSLYKQGAIAQKLVDDAHVAWVAARSQFQTAEQHLQSLQNVGRPEQLKGGQAQVAAAKAHYESAAAQASYAEVRSPIAGVVSDRPLNVGEMAASGSALLSIVDVSRVVGRASIPVSEAASIAVGRPASITSGGVTLQGKVTVVSPAVDPNTTTVQIWVEARNPGERLKLGTTAQIAIDAGDIKNAVSVPASAILSSDEGGDKVMLAGSDGLSHERPVKVGVRNGDDVQIVSGVKPGDRVIIQGGLGLDDKVKIEVAKPGAAEEEGAKGGGSDEK